MANGSCQVDDQTWREQAILATLAEEQMSQMIVWPARGGQPRARAINIVRHVSRPAVRPKCY